MGLDDVGLQIVAGQDAHVLRREELERGGLEGEHPHREQVALGGEVVRAAGHEEQGGGGGDGEGAVHHHSPFSPRMGRMGRPVVGVLSV